MKNLVALLVAVFVVAVVWTAYTKFVSNDVGKKVIKLPGKAPDVAQFILSPDNDAVIYSTFLGNTERKLFLFRVGDKSARELASGHYLSPFSIGTDRVGAIAGESGKRELRVFSFAHGLERSYPIPREWGDPSWASCAGSETAATCAMDKPGLTEDSPEFNALGFTAEGVIDLKTGLSRWFAVPNPTYYDCFHGDFVYVSNQLNENETKPLVTVFDLNGKQVSVIPGMKGTRLSHSGRYYLPQLHEGGLPWEVYDTKTNVPIYSFVPTEASNKYQYYGEWNPTDDDLLTIDTEFATRVYSAPLRKLIRSFPQPKDNRDPYAWTSDGNFLVFYRDGKFVFEPVMP